MDTADVNDDGVVNITDLIFLNNFLSFGGPPPPDPFPACGKELTTDGLSCVRFAPASGVGGPCTQ